MEPLRHTLHKIRPRDVATLWRGVCEKVGPAAPESIEKVVFSCCGSPNAAQELPGLRAALSTFSTICDERRLNERLRSLDAADQADVFTRRVFPRVMEWAAQEDQLTEIDVLTHRSNAPVQSLDVSSRALRSFLSNLFICNIAPARLAGEGLWRRTAGISEDVNLHIDDVVDEDELRAVDFAGMFISRHGVGVSRALAMMFYFLQEVLDEEGGAASERVVSFERHRLPDADVPGWSSETTLVNTDHVIHTGAMEQAAVPCFVDFANRCLHIHTIIASATQEEVLFSCAPECFLSILLYDTLWDRDVAVFRNVRRYTSYSGYLGSFRCTGPYEPPATGDEPAHAPVVQDVVAIDAVMRGHVDMRSHERDLTKCYTGFRAFRGDRAPSDSGVSTGKWGCGIFGGEMHVKFLQQVMAATLAGTPLHYSTFRSEEERGRMEALLRTVEEHRLTVGELFSILTHYRNGPFVDYFHPAVIAAVGAR